MKKYYLFLIILLFPIFVYADTCDSSKIIISDINIVDSKGYVEENNFPVIDGQSVTTNLKLYDVGDSITYSFKIKNNSREDYDLSKNISSDENVSYEIISDNNKIKSGEEKVIQLRISYKNKVDNSKYKSGKYIQNKELSLLLGDNIINPSTGLSIIIIFLFISLLLIIGSFAVINNNNKKYLSLLVLLLMPLLVKASCQYRININSNIEFKKVIPNPCTYDGELVNGAQYVNGQYTYNYVNVVTRPQEEYNIDSMNLDGWGVILTDKSSTDPVTSKLCTSINNKPILFMNQTFARSRAVSIDLSSFDTSNVISMEGMFSMVGDISLDLRDFDTSNVYFMQDMFNMSQVASLDLSSFDTSNVRLMDEMFSESLFEKLDLTNFNTKNVVSMKNMFANNNMTSLDLSSFDTSKVIDMSGMFSWSNIEEMNLRNFNIVTTCDTTDMFLNSKIYSIDVRNIDFTELNESDFVFNNSLISLDKRFISSKLQSIHLKDDVIADYVYNLYICDLPFIYVNDTLKYEESESCEV